MQTVSSTSAKILLIFVVIFEIAFTQKNSPCTTPNGESATCISIRACTVILDALQTQNSSAIDFAKRSQCGDNSEELVCCGSKGFLDALPDDLLNLFSIPTENRNTKEEVEDVILSNFNTDILPDRTVCGLEKQEQNRIFGGQITNISEFPWMVALEYKSNRTGELAGIRCGGTLINNRYVMTAAHCIIDIEFKVTRAWLGDWNITTDPDCRRLVAIEECAPKVQKINIKTEIAHPYYSATYINNDIGLLRLEKDVTYSDYIRPICLPPSNLPVPEIGTRLTVTGWGITEKGTSSDVKLKVEVPLLSNDNCKNKLSNRDLNANQLCAGGEQGKDACQGDSGGPLMRTYAEKVSGKTQWYQEGVVSYGVGCGGTKYPGIYTRVSRYTTWITSNLVAN